MSLAIPGCRPSISRTTAQSDDGSAAERRRRLHRAFRPLPSRFEVERGQLAELLPRLRAAAVWPYPGRSIR